ncbi:MAG: hypothetical protein OEZ68_11500 [Gammaproteobacteria bacterium]|nr:hypothetical protein [Gammaproteobacteria bacterium]MDH5801418.1 hypothetical protein [Gammaproteobacteria bacterium]
MGTPTKKELETALTQAAKMREHGEDPHFMAKSLLNLNYRLKHLEQVLHNAELYLHSGQSATEHTHLVRSIAKYHSLEHRSSGEDEDSIL